MDIVCFDMEGTLTPEIWEQVALDTGLDELNKTTRDIPSYADLMDYRLGIMKKHNLKLADVLVAAKKLDLLEGALDFLQEIRKHFQVVILSDTFHEFAFPLMEKMGHPLLLCHTLNVDGEGNILGYKLRHSQAKKQAILGFQAMGYKCLAAGDSYNDTTMLAEADVGFLFRAPKNVIEEFPQFRVTNDYAELRQFIDEAAVSTLK